MFDSVLGGFLNEIKNLFSSMRPACWGAKAYDKARLEWARNKCEEWANNIRYNSSKIADIDAMQYNIMQHVVGMRRDMGVLSNACSKENCQKNIDMFLNMYNAIVQIYETTTASGFYNHERWGRLDFQYAKPYRVKDQYTESDIDIIVGGTTGGGSTGGNNGGGGTNPNDPVYTGGGSTDNLTYRVVNVNGCGNIRKYNNGATTDMNGNPINLADCNQSSLNGNANFTDWGGSVDWGNGSISVNSGKPDYTPFLIGGGLIAVFLIFNNKKK